MNIKWLWLLLFIFVVADGLITNYLVNNNLAREANYLLSDFAGTSSLIVMKIVGGLVVILLLWHISTKKYTLAKVASSLFVVSYGLIVSWNVLCSFVSMNG